MFIRTNNVFRSSILDLPSVAHAFSTRLGGVSDNPDTASMNVAPGRGDSPDTVRRNTDILAQTVGCTAADCVCAHQVHSEMIRFVTESDRGLGIDRVNDMDCDGFYTDRRGVMLTVRTADCTPILLAGLRSDGTPAIAAVHAGWRGASLGIAFNAVTFLTYLGLKPEDIRAAIGPRASFEDFEVGEDMRDEVRRTAGTNIADKYIREAGGRLHADVGGINREFLLLAGVAEDHIDVSPDSTVSQPELFHSHRRTGERRGAMGNVIVIK